MGDWLFSRRGLLSTAVGVAFGGSFGVGTAAAASLAEITNSTAASPLVVDRDVEFVTVSLDSEVGELNNPPIVRVDGEFRPTVGVERDGEAEDRFEMDLYFEPLDRSPGTYDLSIALYAYSDVEFVYDMGTYVPGDPIPETFSSEPLPTEEVEISTTDEETETGYLVRPEQEFDELFDGSDTITDTVSDGVLYPGSKEGDENLPPHVSSRTRFDLNVVRTDADGNGLATFDAGLFRGAVLVSGYGGHRATIDQWSYTPHGVPTPGGAVTLYRFAVEGTDYIGDGSIGIRIPLVLNSRDVADEDLRLVYYNGDTWEELDTTLVEEVTTASAYHVAYVQARLPAPGPFGIVDASVRMVDEPTDGGSDETDATDTGDGDGD